MQSSSCWHRGSKFPKGGIGASREALMRWQRLFLEPVYGGKTYSALPLERVSHTYLHREDSMNLDSPLSPLVEMSSIRMSSRRSPSPERSSDVLEHGTMAHSTITNSSIRRVPSILSFSPAHSIKKRSPYSKRVQERYGFPGPSKRSGMPLQRLRPSSARPSGFPRFPLPRNSPRRRRTGRSAGNLLSSVPDCAPGASSDRIGSSTRAGR